MRPQPGALTEGPIARTLVKFMLPILLGNILQSLNGSINAVWIGRFLGTDALAAVSNANAVMFLLLGAVFGVSMAATILVAQHYGARRIEEARRVVGTSTTFFLGVSLVIAVAGWLLCTPLLAWMGTPPGAIPYATAYLRMIFVAIPFIYLYTFVMAVLRGAGDSRTPFLFLLLQVGLDIALNPLLIFGFGPVPAFGIAGSSLATLIANAVTLFALVAFLYRRKHELCFHGPDLALLKVDPAILGTLVKKGVPMGLQLLVMSASFIAMITLVNRFGTATTAAYGAAWQLWNYLQMPAFAIGAAVSSMAAQNVGAQRWDRVARVAKVSVALCLVLTGAMIAVSILFDRQALGLFMRPGEELEIARHINHVAAATFIAFGLSMVLFGVTRATGAVFAPLVSLFISLWVVRFPFAEALLPYWGADAIWWSFPVSGVFSAVFALAYYRWGGWRNARMGPGAPAPAPAQ